MQFITKKIEVVPSSESRSSSALSMVRFLMFLEPDAEDEISLHKRQTQNASRLRNRTPPLPKRSRIWPTISRHALPRRFGPLMTRLIISRAWQRRCGICRAKANGSHVSGKHDAA
jgi:hypothetical protein